MDGLTAQSSCRGLLNNDEAILDIIAAAEDCRMHLLCNVLTECCIEAEEALLMYMYSNGVYLHTKHQLEELPGSQELDAW